MAPRRLWIRKSSPGDDHQWRGLSLKDYIIYELHVGTFSQEGTLDSAIAHLPHLKQLGITVIELMPVAAFPGTRNWGYDAVSPFAVQASYGGPEALRRFVDAAHKLGLGVILTWFITTWEMKAITCACLRLISLTSTQLLGRGGELRSARRGRRTPLRKRERALLDP